MSFPIEKRLSSPTVAGGPQQTLLTNFANLGIFNSCFFQNSERWISHFSLIASYNSISRSRSVFEMSFSSATVLDRPQNELNSSSIKSFIPFCRLKVDFFSFDLSFVEMGFISLSLFLWNSFALSINSYGLVAERFREKPKSLLHGSKNVWNFTVFLKGSRF